MKKNETMAETGMSRRSFLGIGALGAASLGAIGLASCAPQQPATSDEQAADEGPSAATEELPPADSEESCDVVVVGMGTSGLVACCAAANEGAHVIGLDRVSSMAGTNTAVVTGAWCIESKASMQYDNYLTVKDMFEYLWPATHYQSNALLLRNILPSTGKGADILADGGIPFTYSFVDADENTSILWRGGHNWPGFGEERAAYLQAALDHYGVDARWSSTVTNLLMENGAVVGVRYEGDNGTVDIKAKNVIVGCGGFIQSEEMQKKYFSGTVGYGTGNQYNDGSGLRLAMSAGAQIGKNFNLPLNESGGCNMKSSARFVSLSDCNETPVFSLPLFGGLLVNKRGKRFIDESKMAKEIMFCSEPLLREGVYYVIIDDGFVNELAKTPITDLINEEAWAKMGDQARAGFTDKTLTNLPSMIEQGIEEGWIWKADTAEELAEATGLTHLPETLSNYNEYCASGVDDELYKEASFLRAVDTGSLYAVETSLAAWCTLGGIKTDERCQAVDANADTIPGLFICGTDGDFWGVPYFQGGSAQGFSIGSGYLAGVSAAQDALA